MELLGLSGLHAHGSVQSDHPYTFVIVGIFLFFAGIAGKKKDANEVGTVVRGV